MRWRTDSLLRRHTLSKSAVWNKTIVTASMGFFFVSRLCPAAAQKPMNARCNKRSFSSLYLLCGLYITTALLEVKAYSKC